MRDPRDRRLYVPPRRRWLEPAVLVVVLTLAWIVTHWMRP
jgi:hypothetical protein